jgi:hypothetical protein
MDYGKWITKKDLPMDTPSSLCCRSHVRHLRLGRSPTSLASANAIVAVLLAMTTASWAADDKQELKKPDSPRAMFRTLGVDDRYFDRLADGKPLGPAEQETVWRVLFRFRTFPLVDVDHWAQDAEELTDAIRQPEKARGSIFHLRGQVVRVEPVNLPKEAAERFELTKVFRCRLELELPARTADIYVEDVPAEWRDGAKVDASGGANGVFLKLAEPVHHDDQPILVFVATRLAWYQDNLLGRLGMDAGLLDSRQSKRLFNRKNAADREAFYQMLAAVGRAESGQILRQAEEDLWRSPDNWRTTDEDGEERYSVTPLFNEPASQRGRLVELLGAARRIERIQLDKVRDADIIMRFGFDHYFEVWLFTDDSDDNPLTFCLRELPEGMPYRNQSNYGETVRVAGFFFKTWSYGVPAVTDSMKPNAPKTRQQLSPLLIGKSLIWYPAPKPADTTRSGIIIGALFLLAMVAAWLVAWRNLRQEKKWLAQMETPIDIGADIEPSRRRADAVPDFSRLAEMDRGPEADSASPPGEDQSQRESHPG